MDKNTCVVSDTATAPEIAKLAASAECSEQADKFKAALESCGYSVTSEFTLKGRIGAVNVDEYEKFSDESNYNKNAGSTQGIIDACVRNVIKIVSPYR